MPIRFVVDEEKQVNCNKHVAWTCIQSVLSPVARLQGGNQFEQGRYCCAVTKKEITNQKVVLIKP